MNMFDSQIKKLRENADILDGLEGMDNLVPMLREAADTIERLQELQGVCGESRYSELFGNRQMPNLWEEGMSDDRQPNDRVS